MHPTLARLRRSLLTVFAAPVVAALVITIIIWGVTAYELHARRSTMETTAQVRNRAAVNVASHRISNALANAAALATWMDRVAQLGNASDNAKVLVAAAGPAARWAAWICVADSTDRIIAAYPRPDECREALAAAPTAPGAMQLMRGASPDALHLFIRLGSGGHLVAAADLSSIMRDAKAGTFGAAGEAVLLHRTDRTVVAGHLSSDTAVLDQAIASVVKDAPPSSPGAVWVPDDDPAMLSYEALANWPLVALVAERASAIDARIQINSNVILGAAGALTLVVLLLGIVMSYAASRHQTLLATLSSKDAMMAGLAEATPAGICVLTGALHVELANTAFTFLVDKTDPTTLVGMSAHECLGAMLDDHAELLRQVAENGHRAEGIYHWRAAPRSGASAQWAYSYFPVASPNEAPSHIGMVIVDVTEREQSRGVLRRWRRVLDRANWGISVWDATTRRIDELNPAFAALHGFEPEELLGTDAAQIVSPGNEGLADCFDRALASGDLVCETVHRHRDGRAFPVESHVAIVRMPDGRPAYFIVHSQDITVRKRAELALREAHDKMEQVLRSLPVAVWMCNPAGKILQANPAAATLWDGQWVPAMGYECFHAEPVEAGPKVDSMLTSLLGTPACVEARPAEIYAINSFDGIRKTLLRSSVPIYGAEGTLTGAVVVMEDITKLRAARDAVQYMRDFFERLFESAPTGIALLDGEGHYVRVNNAFTAALGYSADEINEHSFAAFTHPDDIARSNEKYDPNAGNTAISPRTEKRFVRKNGDDLWVISVSAPVKMNDERTYILNHTVDITQTKAAEHALIESQARLTNAQRIASIGDWSWNRTTGVLRLSSEVCRILGIERVEQVAAAPGGFLHPLFLDYIDPEDCDGVLTRAKNDVRNGQHRVLSEFRIRRGTDGVVRHVRVEAEPLVAGDWKLGAVGTMQDISPQKETELTLIETRTQLRDLVAHQDGVIEEERKRIARDVHDELGQMIAGMTIGLESLLMGGAPALAPRIERLQALLRETADVVRVIVRRLRPATLDLGLVPALRSLAEEFFFRNDIECKVHVDGDPCAKHPASLSDTLYRATQEALTNVARHAHAHQCMIDVVYRRGQIEIAVMDDGVGVKPTSATGGFGLMGIRERLATHGGTLTIQERPGGGTVLRMCQPTCPACEQRCSASANKTTLVEECSLG